MRVDPEIAWINDTLEAVLWADPGMKGYVAGVAFDEFPFGSPEETRRFLQANTDVIMEEVNGVKTFMTYVADRDVDTVIKEAEVFACKLLWRETDA